MKDDGQSMKEKLLGYQLDHGAPDDFVAGVFQKVMGGERSCQWLACLNPHSYAVAKGDAQFKAALLDADWLIPDGAGILIASKILGGNIRQRITGSDIFRQMHRLMDREGGLRVFFLGSTEETLGLIREKMAQDFPNITVAGTYSPPFRAEYSPQELDHMIDAINAAQADVLWVGMTAPKQEKWIYANRERLQVRFAAAIGAVFDFYTGRVKRSHPVFQRLGLEWLPRLVQQPRRLWRRMFISAPIFVLDALKARLTSRP